MDKVLSAIDYGICVFSLEVLQGFLDKERIRTKNLLQYFQKHPDKYLTAIQNGIWIPFAQINAVEYLIKLEGYDDPFNDEWKLKMGYEGGASFNIEIKDGLWFTDANSFLTFDREKYIGCDEVSYETFHYKTQKMITMYSGFRYNVSPGKYLLSIKGFVRKEAVKFPNPNCGFLFSLNKVDVFEGFNNPREGEKYDFNVAKM